MVTMLLSHTGQELAPLGLIGRPPGTVGCGTCCDDVAHRVIGVARHGGYAEYILVPDEKYLADIQGLEPSWAATLACSGLTAYSAVDRIMPLDPDEPVVIIGAGGLGLTAIAVLRYCGHENICAVDVSEANLKLAQELGATHVVTSGEQAAHDIREAVGGPASAVIDFVNNGATATLGFKILTKAGRMVQVGLFGGEVTLPTAPLALRMIRLEGSFVGTVGQMKELVEIAKTGDLPSIPIEERPLSASSVAEALDDLTAGNVSGRIVLTA